MELMRVRPELYMITLDFGTAYLWRDEEGDGGGEALTLVDTGIAWSADDVEAGDAVANVGGRTMLGVFNTDPARAADALRRLAALPVETAVFGHGDPVATGASAALRSAVEQLPQG
ncbi:hypothetical protein [Streptomyces sp. CB01881]|uniref:hypothetical protein n=1 Tax=Streptomyces sp. CB01881 TaxID=2078691 RepID=UPI0011DF49BF|nr:hypothetical protein [Streptomyces sp. CB01881]TYC73232.1 hypothetical protein EH183_13895 [Streptomyces sp. CB01881]